jgi:hypothetical protein
MTKNIILILGTIFVAACAKGGGSVAVSPTIHNGTPPAQKSGVCPFVETEGEYALRPDLLKCTLSGRPSSPDFNFVPVRYEIISMADETGLIRMHFTHGSGKKETSLGLKFPRTPSSDDKSYNGIQCGMSSVNGRSTKTLVHPCSKNSTFCTYTFTQSGENYFVEMHRIQNDQTYACNGQLEKL